jgi:hypothetical protein
MPVTRSSTRPAIVAAAPAATHQYSLRSGRPNAGFYAEVDEEMHAAAATLLSLRAGNAAPLRRSTRIASAALAQH